MSPRNRASALSSIPVVAALAALTALLAGAPEAAACDCAFLETAEPSLNSKKVPANTKIWFSQLGGCDTPVLQKSGGTPVPAALTTVGGTRVLHPEALLEVGSTYEVIGCFEESVTTFTVNEGPDNDPPPRPAVSALDAESSSGGFSSCGSYEYVPLLADQTDVILTLDIAGGASLDPEAVSGKVSDMFFPSQKPIVGNAVCSSSNWSFEEAGPAESTRLGAFDYAGNFSGWSDPQTIETGCGCEAAGAEPTPAYRIVALGLFAVAALRRRRA